MSALTLLLNLFLILCPQVRFLLSWMFADRSADDSLERGSGFALLRSILTRRLVVPEVYDTMGWVQELMVK